MLKGNLSTRPFYNERLVTLVLVAIAAVAAGLTYFNYQQIRTLSAQRSGLQSKVDANEQQTARVSAEAGGVRQKVDPLLQRQLALNTREANDLIDQRTFSWTVLLGILERTLPLDVRLLSISPKIEKGNTLITIAGVAKHPEDVKTFSDALYDANGTFYSVLPTVEQHNDDGTYNFEIEAYYLAPTAPRTPSGKGHP